LPRSTFFFMPVSIWVLVLGLLAVGVLLVNAVELIL
jgi:hypothetical protein